MKMSEVFPEFIRPIAVSIIDKSYSSDYIKVPIKTIKTIIMWQIGVVDCLI